MGAEYMRTDSIPSFTYVEVAKLSDLSSDELDALEWQWRMAHRNAWTSSEIDRIIRAEHDRRST